MVNSIIPQGFIFGGTFKGWEHLCDGALVAGQAVHLVHKDPSYKGTFFLDVERFGQCAIPATCEEEGKPVLFWADGGKNAAEGLGDLAKEIEISSYYLLEEETKLLTNR